MENINKKRKIERVAWGISLIAIAILVLFVQTDVIEISLGAGQIVLGILAFIFVLGGITHRSFGSVFFGLGLAWIGFWEELGLPEVSVGIMWIVVILLTIGFHCLFPSKSKYTNYNEKYDDYDDESKIGKHQQVKDTEEDGYTYCSNKFGALAKYVNSKEIKGASVSNNFGELKVFFDSETVVNEAVEIEVNNSFGELQLFIPKKWNIDVKVSTFAGACKCDNAYVNNDGPKVTIVGNVSFGEVSIHLI